MGLYDTQVVQYGCKSLPEQTRGSDEISAVRCYLGEIKKTQKLPRRGEDSEMQLKGYSDSLSPQTVGLISDGLHFCNHQSSTVRPRREAQAREGRHGEVGFEHLATYDSSYGRCQAGCYGLGRSRRGRRGGGLCKVFDCRLPPTLDVARWMAAMQSDRYLPSCRLVMSHSRCYSLNKV